MPDTRKQIRWGLAFAAAVLLVVVVLAFVPDPFHRQRVITVGLDQVEGIEKGAPVYFRGAQIGSVRDVALIPARRTFDLRLGVRRDWQPSPCSFLTVAASNPFTQPHLELVALEASAPACPAARAVAACDPIMPANRRHDWLVGCKRTPDIIALAAAAITKVSAVAQTTGAMALKLQDMVSAGGVGAMGPGGVGGDLRQSVASLSGILADLDRGMAPGRGDIAMTLANVRRASGQAAQVDIGAVNGTLGMVRAMVADNRDNLSKIVSNGQEVTAQTRELLQTSSRSLAETSANLARVSGSMDALVERMSADPTYAVRGQRFADPPPVRSR